MVLNGNIAFEDGSALPRPTEQDFGNFPRWEMILPTEPVTFSIALDPRLLLDLAEAIGCDGDRKKGITLRFSDELSPIRVSVNDGETTALGVLMPIRMA